MPHECGNLWRQGSEKKGKKGMRPGAVMNLLNVKSCFNPGCTGHDNQLHDFIRFYVLSYDLFSYARVLFVCKVMGSFFFAEKFSSEFNLL